MSIYSQGEEESNRSNETLDATVASGLGGVISQYGLANAEFVRVYKGIDEETGKVLARGHKKISGYRINEEFRDSNLRQQAGFSAEEASVARYNAKQISIGNSERMVRTEDAGIGANDPVHDHLLTENGQTIPSSGSQMKFVGDIDGELRRIAEGRGGGANDHSRYLNSKLDLPSEQVANARKTCEARAAELRKQAEALESKGEIDLALQKRESAENYELLKDRIRDSGVTQSDAMEYRQRPAAATAKDIARFSHKAGLNGAALGAAMGGGVALVTNFVLVAAREKTVDEAIWDCAVATARAAAAGYTTAFTSAAVAGLMRQAANEGIRRLAQTNVLGMAVTLCSSLTQSTKRLITGEIDFQAFIEDIGQSSVSALSSATLAAAGQVLVPVPVVGAMIGGLVGYSLSSSFYIQATQVFRDAKESERRYEELKAFCDEARAKLEAEQQLVERLLRERIAHENRATRRLFDGIDSALAVGNLDEFCASVNRFAGERGRTLDYSNTSEFDLAMKSTNPLSI